MKILGYDFGPFFLDIDERQLFYGGERVKKVTPRCINALELLLLRRIEKKGLIKTDELVSQFLPKGVEDSGISHFISHLRKALADPPGSGIKSKESKERYIIRERSVGIRLNPEIDVRRRLSSISSSSGKSSGPQQVVTKRPESWDAKKVSDGMLWGGIETGGTKCVVAVGKGGSHEIVKKAQIATGDTPEITISEIVKFFRPYKRQNLLRGIGLASFGPLDFEQCKVSGISPKISWRDCTILDDVMEELSVPVSLTTDVNGALFGEIFHGVGKTRNLDTYAYLNVGTGIGASVWVNDDFIHGVSHGEWGHCRVPIDSIDLELGFYGQCHTHDAQKDERYKYGICLEGAASGLAIQKRWGQSGENYSADDDKVWRLEARYLAHGISNLILTLMPQMIILGGGVMKKEKLLKRVHKEVQNILNSYLNVVEITKNISEYIVAPALQGADGITESGVIGAIDIARKYQTEMT